MFPKNIEVIIETLFEKLNVIVDVKLKTNVSFYEKDDYKTKRALIFEIAKVFLIAKKYDGCICKLYKNYTDITNIEGDISAAVKIIFQKYNLAESFKELLEEY